MDEDYEKKNPLWIKYQILFNNVNEKRITIADAIQEMLELAYDFLEKIDDKDLKKVIVAFENLKDNLIFKYGQEAAKYYEDDKIGNILEGFDSLIVPYEKEINKLKKKLKEYLLPS